MESKDLRIGNYVFIEDLEVQVECLPKHYNYNLVNPIPITEEWLLRFGFEKIEYSDERHGFGDEYHLKVNEDIFFNYSDDFSLAIFRNKEAIENEHGILPKWGVTKTVNGLQNVYYSLIGEELILKEK